MHESGIYDSPEWVYLFVSSFMFGLWRNHEDAPRLRWLKTKIHVISVKSVISETWKAFILFNSLYAML